MDESLADQANLKGIYGTSRTKQWFRNGDHELRYSRNRVSKHRGRRSSDRGRTRKTYCMTGNDGGDERRVGENNKLIGNESEIFPMAKYLIEVPHEAEKKACLRAIQILLQTGSHYLTHAQFGCYDGDHKAWVVVDVDSKEEARGILPPIYRSQAKIVSLCRFSLDEVEEMLRHHTE